KPMPRQHLENLITRLHQEFSPGQSSPQQQQLLDELKNHLHNADQQAPVEPSLQDSANLLLESLEVEHPRAAGILREIVETLGRLGI
ncbi:MAG: DUF4404 family protein, partial [Pseudomonadales bacterium]|nr:DUF4404 family protein [Pseudomonadales bacterium]